MAYGLLKYDEISNNLGDEIQSLAARQFLPQVDVNVRREELKSFVHEEPVKMIMNGWYMHSPAQWPPSTSIIPLLTSFHIDRSNPEVAKKLLSGEGEHFFRQYEKPVGVRDLSTLALFTEAKIPAYFSGCLTLTLKRNPQILQGEYVCAVDVRSSTLEWLRSKTKRSVHVLTNEIPASLPFRIKLEMAQAMLEIYQGAHCVVTGRLHAAMPCLAYETPVLLIDTAKDQERFSGLNSLVRHGPEQTLLEGGLDFDVNQPQPNSTDYREYRDRLIKQCVNFIGADVYGLQQSEPIKKIEDKALLMHQFCQWRDSIKTPPRSKWRRLFR